MKSRYGVRLVGFQDKVTIYEPRFLDLLEYGTRQCNAGDGKVLERVRDDDIFAPGRRLSAWGAANLVNKPGVFWSLDFKALGPFCRTIAVANFYCFDFRIRGQTQLLL